MAHGSAVLSRAMTRIANKISADDLRAAFQQHDRTRRGTLSAHKLGQALTAAGLMLSQQELHMLQAQYRTSNFMAPDEVAYTKIIEIVRHERQSKRAARYGRLHAPAMYPAPVTGAHT